MDELNILELIEEKKYLQLKRILEEMNEVDIAEILDDIDLHAALLIFRMLPKDLAVEVFAHFSIEKQRDIISSITDKELNYIIEELFFDDMIDMLEEMPSNIVNKILSRATKEERELINQFLKYPPDSAGSIMTIEYVELKKTMTVGEALAHIKETGLMKETVYTCYVIDRNRKLEGIVSLRNLVTSDERILIEDLMEDEIIYIETHDDQEEAANIFIKYDLLALPVVDREGRLTGIITVDDIMDVMKTEATEDFQRMAAIAPSETPYLETRVVELAKHRIIWLLILMVSATISGAIITNYEKVLSSVVILTSFLPMLMDTSGNAGSQSSTLIVRGLATGEIELKDAPKILWKEFRIALTVGITLAVFNFARLLFIEKTSFAVSALVSVTLIFVVVIAKVIGGILPIAAKKVKLDPAIMAGPLITTIADALSLIVYFSLASAIFKI